MNSARALVRFETLAAIFSFALIFAFSCIGIPIGRSQGVLVADIGMTIDEVRARSTIKMKAPRVIGDGSRMGVEVMGNADQRAA